jgi:hypothetical protein
LLSNCQIEAVSLWALDLLLQRYEKHKFDAAAEFYYTISGISEAASLQGHLFERQVLSHLCGICTEKTFRIRRLTDSEEMDWSDWIYGRHVNFHESTIFAEISEAVKSRERLLMIPLIPNFPAVDSIFYDPNDQVLTCIQITRSFDHPIAVSGLQLIQSWLKRGTPLNRLRPSVKKPWRFVFVVPFGMADTFKSQDLVDKARKTNTKGVADWPKKVQQYVLGLKEESIFIRGSDSSATSSQQVWC